MQIVHTVAEVRKIVKDVNNAIESSNDIETQGEIVD